MICLTLKHVFTKVTMTSHLNKPKIKVSPPLRRRLRPPAGVGVRPQPRPKHVASVDGTNKTCCG